MSNVKPFNYEIDKITERETVFDFVSRLHMGRDLINQDYNPSTNPDDKRIIFNSDKLLKDDLLMNMIRTMDMSHIAHLDTIKTAYKKVSIGDESVIIEIPADCTLYRIIQESTGQDVTKCFKKVGSNYVTEFDVPCTNQDIYKAYYYTE